MRTLQFLKSSIRIGTTVFLMALMFLTSGGLAQAASPPSSTPAAQKPEGVPVPRGASATTPKHHELPTIPYEISKTDGVVTDMLGTREVKKGYFIYPKPSAGTAQPFTGCNGTIVYYSEVDYITYSTVNRHTQSCTSSPVIGTYSYNQQINVVQGVPDGDLICSYFGGPGTHVWYNTDDGSWITAASTDDPRWDTTCS